MSEAARILAVDDSATQLHHLKMLLEGAGYDVSTARDGVEAVELVQTEIFDLVVSDLQMPNLDGLGVIREMARLEIAVPVIVVTAAGSEMIAAQALHAGAASYVPKSGSDSILIPTVQRVLELRQAQRPHQKLADCLSEVTVRWKLINDQALVPVLIRRVETVLQEFGFCDPAQLLQVAMALDEALINAMVHGNLEVSSELRRIDEGRPYTRLIEERLHQQPYSDRRVDFLLKVNAESALFQITDQGPGFKVQEVPDPTDPANLELEGGRGLLLINTFMDSVSHNSTGNQITMTKSCQRDSVGSETNL